MTNYTLYMYMYMHVLMYLAKGWGTRTDSLFFIHDYLSPSSARKYHLDKRLQFLKSEEQSLEP